MGKIRVRSLAFVSLALVSTAFADPRAAAPVPSRGPDPTRAVLGRTSLRFEGNVGQAAAPVRFLTRGGTAALALMDREAVLTLRHSDGASSETTARVGMRLVGARAATSILGEERQPGVTSSFVGADRSRWCADVPTFARVRYHDVYPGVDEVFYGSNGDLEYDFVVAPGADPSAIRIAFDEADGVSVDASGDLVVRTAAGDLRQRAPSISQTTPAGRRTVSGRYVVRGACEVGLEVAAFDGGLPLVVDPVLVFSTFFAPSAFAGDVAVGADGALFLCGGVLSTAESHPRVGASKRAGGADYDVIVVKLGADRSTILYTAYIGGAGDDAAYRVSVDAAGSAYVLANADSTDYPTTPDAYRTARPDPGPSGVGSFAVTKLSPDGASLDYSTYFFSSVDPESLAVDAAGEACIAGTVYLDHASSVDVVDALQPEYGGGPADLFVAKLDAAGAGLVYSTYLGGSDLDVANDVAVDASGAAYVVGMSPSTDFPTTPGTIEPTHVLGQNAFVTKIDPTGSKLEFSTYFGGTNGSLISSVIVDEAGAIYLGGVTTAPDFPRVSAFQTAPSGRGDLFAAKLDPKAASILYSTFLGGSDIDLFPWIAVDSAGDLAIVAISKSTDYPLLEPIRDAIESGDCGEEPCQDLVVSVLSPQGTALIFSSYFGGEGREGIGAIEAVADGRFVFTGGFGSGNGLPLENPLWTAGSFGFVSEIGGIRTSGLPVLRSVTGAVKGASLKKLKIAGSNLQAGVSVFVGASNTPWPTVKRKGTTALTLKGATLDTAFPAGATVRIRIQNPDGAEVLTTFSRDAAGRE